MTYIEVILIEYQSRLKKWNEGVFESFHSSDIFMADGVAI